MVTAPLGTFARAALEHAVGGRTARRRCASAGQAAMISTATKSARLITPSSGSYQCPLDERINRECALLAATEESLTPAISTSLRSGCERRSGVQPTWLGTA